MRFRPVYIPGATKVAGSGLLLAALALGPAGDGRAHGEGDHLVVTAIAVAGLEVVRSISELYRIHGVRTQILSASIRSVQRAVRSWYNGAQICTMPPKVFDQMYDHILTDKGLEIFDKDWAAVKS